ncbi:MAG: hypothetical protein ACP5RM_02930 [Candidatus Micrarchaeia archaeon]
MTFKYAVFALMLMLLTVPVGAFAASPQLIHFLNTYMPNSTINSYAFFNFTIGQNHYVVMKRMYQYSFIVINSTRNFSILQNASQIYAVLRPFMIQMYSPNSSVLNALNVSMQKYEAQAAPPLNDCRQETGLDYYTCNATNACFSCQTVPICGKWLPYYGGPTGVMGLGIMNFSAQYNNLVANYTMFYSAIRNASTQPAKAVQQLHSAISNIAFISQKLPQNPLFPLPQNFSASQMASCSNYLLPTQQPWYCVDIGMCEYTTFNSSLLSSMQTMVQSIASLPLSNSSIMQISSNSSKLAVSFVNPVEIARQKAQFSLFINSIMPKYNATVSNATALLSHVSNATLSSSLDKLEATFASIEKLGINQSTSLANVEISDAISNVSIYYSKVNALYAPIYKDAYNATSQIMLYELNYRQEPEQLAQAAAKMQAIDAMLSGTINTSEAKSMASLISGIQSNASAFSAVPFSFAAATKSIDGGIINAMLYGSGSSIGQKMALAPLYSAMLSFIIGIILMLLLYSATYARLRKSHKIKVNKKVKKAWAFVFIAVFVLVLAYSYVTYAFASSANSFLPISIFTSKLADSSNAVIMVGSGNTINAQQMLCIATLSKELKAQGKNAPVIMASNYSAISSNSSMNGIQYTNKLLANSIPIIYIENGSSSNITFAGMYGYMLRAQGNATYGSSCYLSYLLK